MDNNELGNHMPNAGHGKSAGFTLGILAILVGAALAWQGLQAKPASRPQAQQYTKPIEQIQVGDRVVAHNPQVTDEERGLAEQIDPAQWRTITLRMEKPDDVIDITLLRPQAWVEDVGARAGATVELDLAELGAEGPATVLSVGPCVPIKPGTGAVVTATFAHKSAQVLNLTVEGQSEPIGVTANHPFWSEDRQDFVPAGELWIGENLWGFDSPTRVLTLTPRKTEMVFNVEVGGEHVYCVGEDGILVHNSCLTRIKDICGARVIGFAQKTTQGHWQAIARKAISLAKSGKYEAVYLNKGVNGIFGKVFARNRRPDILAIRKNGIVDLFEVASDGDSIEVLNTRIREVMRQLPSGYKPGIGQVLLP